MKRILTCSVVLTITLTLAVTTARGIGAVLPAPSFAAWFTQANGTVCAMPCLFGIRPGVTEADEVLPLIAAHPYTRELQVEIVPHKRNLKTAVFTDGQNHFEVLYNFRVTSVSILSGELRLGDLSVLNGQPYRVTFPLSGSVVTLSFRNRMEVSLDMESICDFTPLYNASFYLYASGATPATAPIPWLGFASARRYLYEHADEFESIEDFAELAAEQMHTCLLPP